MKVVIIGNGVAGTFSAQNIRNLDEDVEIETYSEENYPYYSRPKLPELISEQNSIEDLIAFKEEWYNKKNLKTFLGKKVAGIRPKRKLILIDGQSEPVKYDKLILATGSRPNIPPINNAIKLLKKGVFTLRNIDDALEIRDYIKNNSAKKAIVIGGGLLGLELAKQIRNCNLDTTVVEFFPRLLPRQLDDECATILKEEIEKMGVKTIVNAATEEILGDNSAKGIKLKDGQTLEADIVLIQAGIRPTIELAEMAKLETNRGIIVNEILQTSDKEIFAVGDCIEYKSQTWGIIPACMEQSRIVASSVLGKKEIQYKGTTPKNTLKIVGIDLCSVGIFNPPSEDEPGWEILRKVDKQGGCYQKLVLKDGTLKGAILFGEKKTIPYVNKNINLKVKREEINDLLEVLIYYCPGCGYIYDEAKEELKFEMLPDDWKCPGCKAPKSAYKIKDN